MGVGFLDGVEPPWYSVVSFAAIWLCVVAVIRSTPSSQLFSLVAAGCGLLSFVGWYYHSWIFFRGYPEDSDAKYCTGLIDGTPWDVALLLVLTALFAVQFWRLLPVIRARLHS